MGGIALRYEINGYWLEMVAEDHSTLPHEFPHDYAELSKTVITRVRGGAPTVKAGSYKPVGIGNLKGMGLEPNGPATADDAQVSPTEQNNVGVVIWYRDRTEYSIRAFGMSVADLIKIAESVE